MSHEHVLRMLGCNSTDADIKQRMLIATSAAMSRGPEALRASLASHANATSFCHRLSPNLTWLWTKAPCFSSLPDPLVDPAPWHDIMLNNHREWSLAIRSAVDQSVDFRTA